MGTRVGIDLSSVACRVVEIDARRSPRVGAQEAAVRSYALLPRGGVEMSERLAALRRADTAVVVWGAQGTHHQVVVPQAGYERMRTAAVAAAREDGVSTDGTFADISPAGARQPGSGSRPVILTLAAADELSLAVQPILDAGLRVRSVMTPACALASLARTRRDVSLPGSLEAYIALEEVGSAVALVRDGVLVAARELPWGYLDDGQAMRQPRRREEVAARLVVALADLRSWAGAAAALSQVCICGGLAGLRSMTLSMMECLDVEVEPLDSLFGIDAAQLPEPSDDFRERIAELRLAWAVAVDWPAPINLFHQRRRQARRTALARAAVVAGIGAGLGAGWLIEGSTYWQSTADIAPSARPGTGARPTPAPLISPPPSAARVSPPAAPSVVSTRPAVPPATLTPRPAPAPGPPVVPRDAIASPSPPAPPDPVPRTSERPPVTPLPFEAVLGTILYSPDRKLAIVDGRIVGPGDEMKGARIVDITPSEVLLRDAQGQLWRLALAPGP